MIRLEGFSDEVVSKKSIVLCNTSSKIPDLSDFLAERSVFLYGKKIHNPLALHWHSWSLTMSVTSGQDLGVALSYMNCMNNKPAVCFVDQGLALPEAFVNKLPPHVTLLKLHDASIQLLPSVLNIYDYIFVPNNITDNIKPLFENKSATDVKELMREVSAADLGLIWSRADSTFYWYEPGPRPSINLHPKQIGNILITIGQNM